MKCRVSRIAHRASRIAHRASRIVDVPVGIAFERLVRVRLKSLGVPRQELRPKVRLLERHAEKYAAIRAQYATRFLQKTVSLHPTRRTRSPHLLDARL